MPLGEGFSIIIGIIVVVILWEYFGGYVKRGFGSISEGFAGAMSVGSSKFLARYIPRRGDVGPEQEEDAYIMDPRYFHDYSDVQGFDGQTDYCRMVLPSGAADDQKFFACALGGTDGLSSVSYRSPTVAEGFRLSRDDYMRDLQGRGINSYCRILKDSDGQFKALCTVGGVTEFRNEKLTADNKPPAHISELLRMYSGCVAWLRLADDMVDYAGGNLYVSKMGAIGMDETDVNPEPVRGLKFDGESGYLRIGDNSQLEFGNRIMLRNMRTLMCWVKFDRFTNNAHIFDFGDGAGINNVFLGIIGRGNNAADTGNVIYNESTVPTEPSGAAEVEELSPVDFLKVDPTLCGNFTVKPRKLEPVLPTKKAEDADDDGAETAHLCYEIWDRDDRKMRVEIPNAFMKGVWTHVAIAAVKDDPYRPDIAFYINGKLRHTQPSGWLPQRSETTKNYIGRSNWIDATGPFANKSQLFEGSLWDFRMYNTVMVPKLIQESYKWGAKKLKL